MAFNFPDAPTLGQEVTQGTVTYKWTGAGWALKGTEFVRIAGDTMSGALVIAKIAPNIILNKSSDASAEIMGQRGGLARWRLVLGGTAPEGAGNSGADFVVVRYGNDGVQIDTPMIISRADGRATLTQDPITANGIATKNYVDNRALQRAAYGASGSFTAPPGTTYNTIFKVTVTGGGGGGGAGTTGNVTGAGGGAGGTAIKWMWHLVAGNVYAVTVGAGGAGGTSSSAGGNGGTSSFAGPEGQTPIATGGTGGQTLSTTTGQPGGMGSGGDINQPGGGSQAGTENGSWRAGGVGGASIWGGGGSSSAAPGAGTPPAGGSGAFGAGGGGGGSTSVGQGNGGAGSGGIVVIEWVCS